MLVSAYFIIQFAFVMKHFLIVVQTVQLAKEEITKVESSGFISFLNDTNYSTFQGKNISVNYPSSTIKERLPDGIFIIKINF